MYKNLNMGPEKLIEGSPEGDFKDSITRKRWLGAASPPNNRLPSLPRGFRFFLAASAAASVLALGLVYRSVYFSPAPSNKYNFSQKKTKNRSYSFFRNRNSEFQGLLDGCLHVYLDVGSHHGIQVSFQRENMNFFIYAAIFFLTCRRFASSTSPATSRKQRCCLPSIPISERVSRKRVCTPHYHAGEKNLPEIKKTIYFPRWPDEARCLRSWLRGKPISNQHVSKTW